jgi:hypothetical protein
MKTEVYSWRVSTELKTDLEREARRRKTSLSAVLDLAAKEWLANSDSANTDSEEQHRLQQAALKCFGAIATGNAHGSENVRRTVRQSLRRQHGR